MSEKTTSSNALEQFVLLAKSAKGPAAAELVRQAVEAPGVFVFGELLEMPNVQELANSHSQYFELLKLFCFGNYKDYTADQSKFYPLNETMLEKLRFLTLVSVATQRKSIPYSVLLEELDLQNMRALEDLVISAMYSDVLHGRLEQRGQLLQVDWVMSRDVLPEQVQEVASVLEQWCANCEAMLSSLEAQIVTANQRKEESLRSTQKIEEEMSNLKKTFKATQDVDDAMVDSSNPEKIFSKKGGKPKGLRGSAKK